MVFLTAAVILLGALVAVDLLLTVGVIRRLREHTERLDQLGHGFLPEPSFPPGSAVPDFETTDSDGDRVATADLAGAPYVLAFLSTGCSACHEQLPAFAELAGRVEGGRSRVVAIVEGAPDQVAAYVETLAPVARVVTGEHALAVHTRFDMSVLPTYLVLDGDGTVRVNTSRAQDLDPASLGSLTASAG